MDFPLPGHHGSRRGDVEVPHQGLGHGSRVQDIGRGVSHHPGIIHRSHRPARLLNRGPWVHVDPALVFAEQRVTPLCRFFRHTTIRQHPSGKLFEAQQAVIVDAKALRLRQSLQGLHVGVLGPPRIGGSPAGSNRQRDQVRCRDERLNLSRRVQGRCRERHLCRVGSIQVNRPL